MIFGFLAVQLWRDQTTRLSGDSMMRIMVDQGSGFTEVYANNRILGNYDGVAAINSSHGVLGRHHRTVHAIFSFTTTGTSFTAKLQAKHDNSNVVVNFFHEQDNRFQLFEYDKS